MFVFPREKGCWRRVLASVFSLLITSVGLNAELYAAVGYGVQVIGVGKGSINAVAYASDGTLVLGHSNSQDLTVIAPDGIQSTLSVAWNFCKQREYGVIHYNRVKKKWDSLSRGN